MIPMFEPVVKWSGSKRSQAQAIVSRMPYEIDSYYEPFCGGCSVLNRLLHTQIIKVKRYIASDLNADLIALWNAIKNNPEELIRGYAELWAVFNRHSGEEDFERKKEVFYTVRERYNKEHSPIDFLFIMRTNTNGMPRYNDKGEFNNSCHFSRPGIAPRRLRQILLDWSRVLNVCDVEFVCRPYQYIDPKPNDVVYCDPPYANTKGMYFGGIELDKFFDWLKGLKCRWLLSFDGRRGETDCTHPVPQEIYACHEYIKAGNSSFERYLGNGNVEEVFESLYMNYQHKTIQQIEQMEFPPLF